MLAASADSQKLHAENNRETMTAPSSNTRFFSTICRYFIFSPALTSETFFWKELCISEFYFAGIYLCSLNLTHFSWLCHRAPPSRTSFSFCILQVLCRLLTPFACHHIAPHIATSLHLCWEYLLNLLLQSNFFRCGLSLLQVFPTPVPLLQTQHLRD